MSDIGLGTRVGEYRVVALIGQGGMGTVYRAEHGTTGRQVALKVLSESLAASEPFRRRFVREARYARELDHPNIVRVEEVADDAGLMYMVMPEVQGTDLKMLLALDGPLEALRAVAILTPIAGALDALHERGILHRDIKPGNVIVASGAGSEPAGTAYLTDFGLGKDPNRDSGPLTAVGEFVGTFQYAAPEQVLGQGLDRRVDIYSLGCVLYECLTGQPPFTRERAVDVLDAHLEDPPPKVTPLRPELSPEIDSVVERALAKDPAERYATAAEMMDAAGTALGVALEPAGATPGDRQNVNVGEAAGEPPAGLRLRIREGNDPGTGILVDDELVIGRASSGDGGLAGDPQISRRHARIWRSTAGFMVEDLGSRNGTRVGDQPITQPRLLVAGDVIEVGGTLLIVEGAIAGSAFTEPARTLSVRLEIDFDSRETRVALGRGGTTVRVFERDRRWTVEPSEE